MLRLGEDNFVLVTLDTLRFDVAQKLWAEGRTPNFAKLIGPRGWEERHAPGNFTYASHAAMFAGFFPTPACPGRHLRTLALKFPGAETIGPETVVFDAPDIVAGFSRAGYRTLCAGGVGFFNKQTPLGSQFPALFEESHWESGFGVTDPRSTENQVRWIESRLAVADARRIFLFLNISALHQPNYFFSNSAARGEDTLETHAGALEYVDRALIPLFELLRRRGPSFVVLCSDHGTAYGEDGYSGHRLAHPVVWTVPYAEVELR